MSLERLWMNQDRREELLALAAELRPDLHRYCARLMGSVIDGEDVVQDTLVRAFVALQDLEEAPSTTKRRRPTWSRSMKRGSLPSSGLSQAGSGT